MALELYRNNLLHTDPEILICVCSADRPQNIDIYMQVDTTFLYDYSHDHVLIYYLD